MTRNTRCPAGCVPLKAAAGPLGLHPETIRRLVRDGRFTPLRRTPSRNSALFLAADEIAAFVAGGGLDAVPPVVRRKAADRAAAARD